MTNDSGTWQTWQQASRNDRVTVGTSSVTISPARQGGLSRNVIYVRNTSTNASSVIWITFGPTPATVGYGIRIGQYDGIIDSKDSGYDNWQGTINAICEDANGILSIMER